MRKFATLAFLALLAAPAGASTCKITAGDPKVCDRSWSGGNGDFEVVALGSGATSVLLEMDIGGGYRGVGVRTDRGGQADCDHTAAGQFCTFVAPRGAFLRVTVTGGSAETTVAISGSDEASVFELGALTQIADLCAASEVISRNAGDTAWECASSGGGAATGIDQDGDSTEEVSADGTSVFFDASDDGTHDAKIEGEALFGPAAGVKVSMAAGTFKVEKADGLLPILFATSDWTGTKSALNDWAIDTTPTADTCQFWTDKSSAPCIGSSTTRGILNLTTANIASWDTDGFNVADGERLQLPESAAAPTITQSAVYYDTDTDRPTFYTGAAWGSVAASDLAEDISAVWSWSGGRGASPPPTCTAVTYWIDTDETDDTVIATTNDNALLICHTTDTWKVYVDIP